MARRVRGRDRDAQARARRPARGEQEPFRGLGELPGQGVRVEMGPDPRIAGLRGAVAHAGVDERSQGDAAGRARRDLVAHGRDLGASERGEARAADLHAGAGRRGPGDLALEPPRLEVEAAAIALEAAVQEVHRRAVHLQLDRGDVSDVEDSLVVFRVAVGPLAVADGPLLEKAVHQGAPEGGVAPLLLGASDADMPVADHEERLAQGRETLVEPLVDHVAAHARPGSEQERLMVRLVGRSCIPARDLSPRMRWSRVSAALRPMPSAGSVIVVSGGFV